MSSGWQGKRPEGDFEGNWHLSAIELAISQDEFWPQKHEITNPLGIDGKISDRLYAEGFRGVWKSRDCDEYLF